MSKKSPYGDLDDNFQETVWHDQAELDNVFTSFEQFNRWSLSGYILFHSGSTLNGRTSGVKALTFRIREKIDLSINIYIDFEERA